MADGDVEYRWSGCFPTAASHCFALAAVMMSWEMSELGGLVGQVVATHGGAIAAATFFGARPRTSPSTWAMSLWPRPTRWSTAWCAPRLSVVPSAGETTVRGMEEKRIQD